MVGSVASSSARSSHGVDRFYHPPQKRQHLQLQQQQQQRTTLQRPQQPPPPPQRSTRPRPARELRDSDNRAESDSSSSRPSPSPPPRSPPGSNLDRFIESTTPLVRAQCFAKKGMRGLRHSEAANPFYILGDLWEAFAEWSAYGAGVPLLLNDSDEVIQYYVPYLSGIQLYVRGSSGTTSRARRSGENIDGELSRDPSSEGSTTDCGIDRRSDHFLEAGGRQQIVEQVSRLSLGDKGHGFLEVPHADESDFQKESAHLAFQYFERDSPYARQPLADKISSLADGFPDLKTYKSSDLVSSSWLSVAWYPIYRIPTGPTLKDLDACFLTFHLLSMPSKNPRNGYVDLGSSIRRGSNVMDWSVRLPLPVFGLASYKFKDSIWNQSGLNEQHKAASLQQAADDWLKKIPVELPDFRFFVSHGNYRR